MNRGVIDTVPYTPPIQIKIPLTPLTLARNLAPTSAPLTSPPNLAPGPLISPPNPAPGPPPLTSPPNPAPDNLILYILLLIYIFVAPIIIPILFLTHSDITSEKEDFKILAYICIVVSFIISVLLFIKKFTNSLVLNAFIAVLMIFNCIITIIIYDKLKNLNNNNKDYNLYLIYLNVPTLIFYCVFIFLAVAKGYNHTKT
jgi:hypothetical protein